MRAFIALYWPLIFQIVLASTVLILAWVYLPALWGAPYVPSSQKTVKKMLQMAQMRRGQKVVDLGAGDGRIVIAAARLFEAQAVGVEIDPLRWLIANALILLLGLRGRAQVHYGNMWDFDLGDADVVTLYLLQGTNPEAQGLVGRTAASRSQDRLPHLFHVRLGPHSDRRRGGNFSLRNRQHGTRGTNSVCVEAMSCQVTPFP